MFKKVIFFCLFSLAACTSSGGMPSPISPEGVITALPSPTITSQAKEPCAYVSAYQNLPDLSAKVDQAMKALQPESNGRAQAYGENCVYMDGHADFQAMETDFYVTIPVTNLKDNNDLGTWISRVMKALASFSPGVVPGPQPGFVEFTFKASDDQKVLRVPISKYEQLASGLSGVEVIKELFPTP